MRIAVITDNGQTISPHFGRALHYLVVTVEDGKITKRELRDKLGHTLFAAEGHGHEGDGDAHGHGPQAQARHARMAEAIADCEAILCGGMGAGAYQSMLSRGIRPVVTDLTSIDDAVLAYARGTIVDRTDLLH
jgi:predicted Fe-Mo cluster-binding NifX family protein